jgi:predicted ribosomally synthesized peptide with SipW-like signal peptide
MRKKIIYSLFILLTVGALVIGGTRAFFSDTEVSTGNTFVAGQLDLKVDSECHYYHLTGFDTGDGSGPIYTDIGCPPGVGNWYESDLGLDYKFFYFTDLKPGDKGKNKISLHVYDNDAWGLIKIANFFEDEGSCSNAELKVEPDCDLDSTAGELDENIEVKLWLDEGVVPGFQGQNSDTAEGDNTQQANEKTIWQGHVSANQSWRLSDILAQAYQDDDCAHQPTLQDGHNDYGLCHGLATDGRMVASTTYYFGIDWSLPSTVSNIVQGDELYVDLVFSVVQHRNNPLQDNLGI